MKLGWGRIIFVAGLIIFLWLISYETEDGFFSQEGFENEEDEEIQEDFRGRRRGSGKRGPRRGRGGYGKHPRHRPSQHRRRDHGRNGDIRRYPGSRYWNRWWRPSYNWNWRGWWPWGAVPMAGYWNSNPDRELYPTYGGDEPAMGLSNCDYNSGKCVFGNLCQNYMGPTATCCAYDYQCQ